MAPWDYPPEYGIEPGEVCYRGRCRGRMVVEREICDCWEESLADLDEDEEPPETFTCTCGLIVICGVCGEGQHYDE